MYLLILFSLKCYILREGETERVTEIVASKRCQSSVESFYLENCYTKSFKAYNNSIIKYLKTYKALVKQFTIPMVTA